MSQILNGTAIPQWVKLESLVVTLGGNAVEFHILWNEAQFPRAHKGGLSAEEPLDDARKGPREERSLVDNARSGERAASGVLPSHDNLARFVVGDDGAVVEYATSDEFTESRSDVPLQDDTGGLTAERRKDEQHPGAPLPPSNGRSRSTGAPERLLSIAWLQANWARTGARVQGDELQQIRDYFSARSASPRDGQSMWQLVVPHRYFSSLSIAVEQLTQAIEERGSVEGLDWQDMRRVSAVKRFERACLAVGELSATVQAGWDTLVLDAVLRGGPHGSHDLADQMMAGYHPSFATMAAVGTTVRALADALYVDTGSLRSLVQGGFTVRSLDAGQVVGVLQNVEDVQARYLAAQLRAVNPEAPALMSWHGRRTLRFPAGATVEHLAQVVSGEEEFRSMSEREREAAVRRRLATVQDKNWSSLNFARPGRAEIAAGVTDDWNADSTDDDPYFVPRFMMPNLTEEERDSGLRCAGHPTEAAVMRCPSCNEACCAMCFYAIRCTPPPGNAIAVLGRRRPEGPVNINGPQPYRIVGEPEPGAAGLRWTTA